MAQETSGTPSGKNGRRKRGRDRLRQTVFWTETRAQRVQAIDDASNLNQLKVQVKHISRAVWDLTQIVLKEDDDAPAES
jgi:hypothetical protein